MSRDGSTNEGARAAVHDRDLRVGAYLDAVADGPRGRIIPKAELIASAAKYAASNGLADDSFFQGDRERLEVYLTRNFPRIRKALWADARFLCPAFDKSGRMIGYRRENAAGLTRFAEWACKVLEAAAESQHEDADLAKGVARLPKATLAISLPRPR